MSLIGNVLTMIFHYEYQVDIDIKEFKSFILSQYYMKIVVVQPHDVLSCHHNVIRKLGTV